METTSNHTRRDAGAAVLLSVALGVILSGCDDRPPPDSEVELRKIFAEARGLDENRRFHEAFVRYETILAQHPEWASTRLNAAMSAFDSGQYEKAVTHFNILHLSAPREAFLIRKLIQCYERLEQKDKAEEYRVKLMALRGSAGPTEAVKTHQGFTRDYLPIGNEHHLLIYEFFEPAWHGKYWYFKVEQFNGVTATEFQLESSPFFLNDGRRIFYLTEYCNGWLRVWYVGPVPFDVLPPPPEPPPGRPLRERDFRWARQRVVEVLEGKQVPLAIKPLGPGVTIFDVPGRAGSAAGKEDGG